MRALLFGAPPHRYEPHGVAAPAVRAVAWGLAAVCGLLMVGGAVAYGAGDFEAAGVLAASGVVGLTFVALVRILASCARAAGWSPPGDDR